MDVVFASNDNYARHLAVSMCSLMDHNQVADRIRVFILSVNLSQENKEKLSMIAQRYAREIIFIPMGNLQEKFPYAIETGGFDISTMSRLFIGTMLPEDVHRVLYLDCDTVVLGSLKKLYHLNLRGNIMGAVLEPTIYSSLKPALGLRENDPYFNAGVLLIDLETWRKEHVEERLLAFYQGLGGHTFGCDQDILNGTLKGNIRVLSPRYNFFTNYRYFRYQALTDHSPSYRVVSEKNFRQAKVHPVILHFAGDERPWKAGNLNHYRRAYEQYLAMTPWQGTKKEGDGKQKIYLFAYHMMDWITWFFPAVRWWISKKFGMKAVENRKRG
ncbi:MAG: glycosyltransferase family 8 protein [Lachnospiraceae bacterium]|nr:glycosyltransferase family 8 protein [Lachnospiraceae bacterium]